MNDIVRVDTERLRAHLEAKLPPKVRRFRLDDIPGAMRSRLGWPVAATLMERWFRSTASEMPNTIKSGQRRLIDLDPTQLDEGTVTMQWALGFARVKAAMSRLQNQWNSVAGLEQLQRKVTRQMAAQTRPWRFGDLAQPAKVLDHDCQVNFLNVGRFGDPMDDFYGAMGEASLKIAVSGLVTSHGLGKVSVAIDEPKTLLDQSDVVDLWMNGDIEWQLDPPVQAQKVYVGRDVIFKDIPPECTNAARIPGCPNARP